MNSWKWIFLLCCIYEVYATIDNKYEDDQSQSIFDDKKGPGNPLYLTKYINNGGLEEGRKAASVKPFVGNIVSYSGYLTVNKKYNSNMFFWYFESEADYRNAPTVVWLQGGPGSSLQLGLFNEHGPYIINKKKISKRKHRWSKISNLIYFDNPVGTGYSFTGHESGYATNQTEVGEGLYEALVQVFRLFPHLKFNDLFLTGESYAGKYVPALGHMIHKENQNKPEIYFKLKGLMIGNGLFDPIHMLNYGDYLYQLGLIDDNGKRVFQDAESKVTDLIKRQDWSKATELFTRNFRVKTSLIHNYTGLSTLYNYVNPDDGIWTRHETSFVNSDYFRRRVHVGTNVLHDTDVVFKHLYDDRLKSVVDWVVELLQHYRILFYNGQLDLLVPYPFTVNALKNMNWSNSNGYKVAERYLYEVDGVVAGYYKTAGNLTEMLIRDAGHLVPANQPAWAYQLFRDFINGKF